MRWCTTTTTTTINIDVLEQCLANDFCLMPCYIPAVVWGCKCLRKSMNICVFSVGQKPIQIKAFLIHCHCFSRGKWECIDRKWWQLCFSSLWSCIWVWPTSKVFLILTLYCSSLIVVVSRPWSISLTLKARLFVVSTLLKIPCYLLWGMLGHKLLWLFSQISWGFSIFLSPCVIYVVIAKQDELNWPLPHRSLTDSVPHCNLPLQPPHVALRPLRR